MNYHGPSTEAWLRERGVENQELTESQERRMREWKRGAVASEELVDTICCRVGHIHLAEIPDEVKYGHKGFEGLELVEDRVWVRKAPHLSPNGGNGPMSPNGGNGPISDTDGTLAEVGK